MNETNFDWDDLRLFLSVAREGGLAAAAGATGKSAPTLGRRMLALEKRLGQELFERLPRGYKLTGHGEALLATAIEIEHRVTPITRSSGGVASLRVKISAGTWVTRLLSGHINHLIDDPAVLLQFISADNVLDIAHREAVIGIRNQRPSQISLAGRQIKSIKFAVYASHESIASWASVTGSTPSANWVKNNIGDSPYTEVSNPRNALDMAIAGAVKLVLPTFVGNAEEGLQQVSEEIPELEHMQWLVTHHEDRHVPQVRRVIDRLYNVLIES